MSSSVADPGAGAFLSSGSGMHIPDHISESSETIFFVKILYLNFFMRIRILDLESSWPGMDRFGSGIRNTDAFLSQLLCLTIVKSALEITLNL